MNLSKETQEKIEWLKKNTKLSESEIINLGIDILYKNANEFIIRCAIRSKLRGLNPDDLDDPETERKVIMDTFKRFEPIVDDIFSLISKLIRNWRGGEIEQK